MIHVINTLRANLIRKDIESTVLDAITPLLGTSGMMRILDSPTMFRTDRMLRRLERLRRQRYAPWKDSK